jgi:hypothetical protein
MTLRRGALTVNTTMGNSVTQNAYNVGKSRKPNFDMHGIYTEKFRLTAGEFYPELAHLGNLIFLIGAGSRPLQRAGKVGAWCVCRVAL